MPITLRDAIQAASTISDLTRQIDRGELALYLGDLSLAAARAQLDDVPKAVDKSRQVSSCVTQLKLAERAYEQYIDGRKTGDVSLTRQAADRNANLKRRYVLTLEVLCYRYLSEEALWREAFEKAQADYIRQYTAAERWIRGGYFGLGVFSGFIIADIAYGLTRGATDDKYAIDDATLDKLGSLLSEDGECK